MDWMSHAKFIDFTCQNHGESDCNILVLFVYKHSRYLIAAQSCYHINGFILFFICFFFILSSKIPNRSHNLMIFLANIGPVGRN